jgi:hypothetical protein
VDLHGEIFSSDLHAGPGGGGGVHGGIFTQQCNGSGVEVVTLLSAGRDCNVEELAVCQDAALGSIQAKGRKNLDSLAGCGIICCEHLFHFRNRSVRSWAISLFVSGLSPR